MSGELPSAARTGARPVADAPVGALAARGEELAQRWAVALIRARPLAEMPELPLEALAREAPGLCAQLVRALDSDRELDRVLGRDERAADVSPAGLLAALGASGASARDASSVVDAVEMLREVVWDAAFEELSDPSPRQVADLADRLAYLCSALVSAALSGRPGALATAGAAEPAGASPSGGARARVLYSTQRGSGSRAAVLIDERDDAALAPAASGAQPAPAGRAAARGVAQTAGARQRIAHDERQEDGERRGHEERRDGERRGYRERGGYGERRDDGERGERTAHDERRAHEERAAQGERVAAPRTSGRPRPWDTPLDVGEPVWQAGERGAGTREPPDQPGAVLRVTRGPAGPGGGRA